MLFNSPEYLLFFPLALLSYWLLSSSIKGQNLLLVALSYFFYGWWDYRFLSLIIISSLADYLIGQGIGRTHAVGKKKQLLAASLVINLGMLFFFKYFNFFIHSLDQGMQSLGVQLDLPTLSIILPIGISFYTFQTLSYTIDVYRGKMEPTKDIVAFFAYVSFFPQLVAGPIERATNLLPQFQKSRKINPSIISDASRQILWGFFKKIVIADNCAVIVNMVFEDPTAHNGPTLLFGAVLFAFQIYGDFSGYSDIAIGTAKLFGFSLMTNFSTPYFARDIAEFWRRWHISLTTWFRDYLYIPLGGSRTGLTQKIRNIFVIFLVSGLWHGANWTFVIWGLLNALFFLPLFVRNKNRRHLDHIASDRLLPDFRTLSQMLITFLLVTLTWIFFRAESVSDAWQYLSAMASSNWLVLPQRAGFTFLCLALIGILIVIEYINREYPHQLAIERFPAYIRHSLYSLILLLIFFFGNYNATTFIYFQF